MKRIAPLWKNVVFSAAIAAALGFGTAQAFATPAPTESPKACTNTYCRKVCGTLGGNWVPQYGYCVCCG